MLHLIIVLVLIGVALYIVQLIPMDATVRTIVRILVIVFAVLYALQALGIVTGFRL